MHVIAWGDPFNGIVLVGPFPTAEDAIAYAETDWEIRHGTWSVVPLDAPATEDQPT